MYYYIEDFKNDPNWRPSFGEKLDKIHFRNDHYHAVCDPNTGICEIHYDEIDPHKSPSSLVKHMWDSDLGKVALIAGAIGTATVLDEVFNDGKLRKSIAKHL